jgi:hypothetical protein
MKEQFMKELQDIYEEQDLLLYERYEKGELEYWDGGNADDTFNLGIEIGATDMLMHIMSVIEGMQEK